MNPVNQAFSGSPSAVVASRSPTFQSAVDRICPNCGEAPILGYHNSIRYPCFCIRRWTRVHRILSCRVEGSDACWPFNGHVSSAGYGSLVIVYQGRKIRPAHRISYLLFVGFLEEGKEINHICRNKACVNPDHLELVTHTDNLLWRNFTKTHCINGHEYTPENTVWDRSMGCKRCLKCRAQQNKL